MKTFKSWIENQVLDQAVNPTIAPNNTLDQSSNQRKDPEIKQHGVHLDKIWNNLRNIFAQVRRKNPWLNPNNKASFEREMIQGIDGVGRSRAMLK